VFFHGLTYTAWCCSLFATGDPYQVFGYEFMHNWSLGVMSQVVSYIKPYVDRTMARRGAGTNILRCLDVRLLLVPRAEGFRLPTYSRYFSKPANITASEHQAVSQVMPQALYMGHGCCALAGGDTSNPADRSLPAM
jgi:hypothetical protein